MNIAIATPLFRRPLLAAALLAGHALFAQAGESQQVDPEAGDPYPLLYCIVTEEPLDEDALVFTHEGREIRTCCFDCEDDLKQDYDAWIRRIDDRIIQQQQARYPLTTCVVDGKPLEETDSLNFVFRNRLFLLGSFECQEELQRQPAVYFARLDRAVIKKQKPAYPLSARIITGKPLGGPAIDDLVEYVLSL